MTAADLQARRARDEFLTLDSESCKKEGGLSYRQPRLGNATRCSVPRYYYPELKFVIRDKALNAPLKFEPSGDNEIIAFQHGSPGA